MNDRRHAGKLNNLVCCPCSARRACTRLGGRRR